MGRVYLATRLRMGQQVALKVLDPALAEDQGFRARFEREWRLAASLNHPNVIPIFDAGEVDGRLYLAMLPVAGEDLANIGEDAWWEADISIEYGLLYVVTGDRTLVVTIFDLSDDAERRQAARAVAVHALDRLAD